MHERTSRIPNEPRDEINITRRQLNEWLNKSGGTEISPIEKPLDTAEHKAGRLRYFRDHNAKLTSRANNVAYLDENFFTQLAVGRRLNAHQIVSMKRMGLTS